MSISRYLCGYIAFWPYYRNMETSSKQHIKCLAQGYIIVTPVSLEQATLRSPV